jgi:peptide/nickel transport system permease protein
VVAYGIVAALAGLISPYPAGRDFVQLVNHPQPPSLHGGHLLGTDLLGHDMLTQLLFAVRESMTGSFICMLGATVIGVVVGAFGGYHGGAVDAAVGWLTGVVVTIPAVAVLALVVLFEAPIAPFWFGIVLMLYLWTGVARVVRSSFASLRGREFVEAANAAGASGGRIVFRHLLPNSSGAVLISATAIIGQSMIVIATVDYFGYGNENPAHPTLGGLVADAAKTGVVATPWWLYAIPAIALALLLVCVNVTVDGLTDALDPRRRR